MRNSRVDYKNLLKKVKNYEIKKFFVNIEGSPIDLVKLVNSNDVVLDLYWPNIWTGAVTATRINLDLFKTNPIALSDQVRKYWYCLLYASICDILQMCYSFQNSIPDEYNNINSVLIGRLEIIRDIYEVSGGTVQVCLVAQNIVKILLNEKVENYNSNIVSKLSIVMEELQALCKGDDWIGRKVNTKQLRPKIAALIWAMWKPYDGIIELITCRCSDMLARKVFLLYSRYVPDNWEKRNASWKSEAESAVLNKVFISWIEWLQKKNEQKKQEDSRIHDTEIAENVDDEIVPIADPFYFTDRECIRENICPICGNQLAEQRYNIPVFDRNNIFVSYYIQTLLLCARCKNIFVTKETYSVIQDLLKSQKKYIAPNNIHLTARAKNNGYLFEPIAGFELYFEHPKNTSDIQTKRISSLRQVSFLTKEGYNTALDEESRHRILQIAVSKYGKRKVADILRFFINTREAQKNGKTKYQRAISIWNLDLIYIVRL